MDTSVKMQDYFSNPIWPIILISAVILVIVVLIFIPWKKKKPQEIKVVAPRNPLSLKEKYIRRLDEILDLYRRNVITEKEVFHRLSNCIRHFVYEMTGIKVINYTLKEIREVGIDSLTTLISECYPPEFMKHGEGDALLALEKAKGIISLWN